MQLHDKADQDEQRRRRAYNETTRIGLALTLTPEQVVQRREASTLEWADWLTVEMRAHRADDPSQILPQVCAKLEERIALISREVAKVAAEQIFREKLGKALK